MKRLGFVIPCCLLIVLVRVDTSRADLASEVQAVSQDRLLHRATMGVQIICLGANPSEMREIYGRDAHVTFMPASNLKIVTTSAALDKLGPDFKFKTVLVKHDQDLALVGDGDPTFGDSEYLRHSGWKITTVFENWAAQLRKLGVSSVRDVVVDDSVFDETFFHPHWPTDQADQSYEAQVGGMNLNENLVEVMVQPGAAAGMKVSYSLDPPTHYLDITNNCVTGTQNAVGIARQTNTNRVTFRGQTPARGGTKVSATIHDPALYAVTVLRETLEAGGIKVTGAVKRDRTVRRDRTNDGQANAGRWTVIGIHETPLAAVLARANKDSVNLYAECLCKRIGCEPGKMPGSWENGTVATADFLKRIGVPETDFHLDDGSGLSKSNAISPRAIVRVLCYDFYGKNRETYTPTLSVAGMDGTLKDRFRGSDLRQRVFGKSGYISGVSTLSGYLRAKNDQWYAFSILMNGVPAGANGEVKPLQERIVRALDAGLPATAAK